MYNTVTIRCIKCSSMFRINNVSPITTIGIYKYCVNCGSDRVSVTQDSELGYWEFMSQEYKMPISAIQDIYDLWVQDRSGTNFRDFVRQTKRMLKGLRNAV